MITAFLFSRSVAVSLKLLMREQVMKKLHTPGLASPDLLSELGA